MPDAARYVVYWIDNAARRESRTGSLRWTLPFATAREAREWAKGKVDDGEATQAAVWEFPAGGRAGRLRRQEVYPASAQKVVAHHLDMQAAAGGAEGTREAEAAIDALVMRRRRDLAARAKLRAALVSARAAVDAALAALAAEGLAEKGD